MRALLICGNRPLVAAAGFLLWVGAAAFCQTCGPTDEIVSNNMIYLAGSGDTLWAASFRQGWGLNYTTNRGAAWKGYSLGCYADAVMNGIAFGAGTLVAILNPPDDALDRTRTTTVWHFTHANTRTGTFSIQWSDSVSKDTTIQTHAMGAVFAAGKFYFGCHHGGLVRWDPATDSLRGFLPGDTGSFVPSAFSRGQHPRFGTDTTTALSVDRFGDTSILAVTAPRLLLFNTARQIWDTGITNRFADGALKFESYSSAFVNNTSRPPLLYAYINYKDSSTSGTLFSLFRYHSVTKQWTLALSHPPRGVAPAVNGYLYVLIDTNSIRIYRDSVSDTAVVNKDSLKVVVTEQNFDARLLRDKNISKPAAINDLLFLPTGDTTGSMCFASSDGLFVSWNEVLGGTTVTGDFTQFKLSRAIKSGLAETYAVPGIITDDPRWSPVTTFAYKLSRDGNVTIRIYDFNMQYVKSVVENAPRKAAAPLGRSTDSRFDVWDGTNASGRPVAPGVYYYKITASTGERSFGKIVVAKGQGN
jgi:hypothetical protein